MKANPDPQRAEDRELARTIARRDPLGTKKLLDDHYASMYRFAFHLSRRSEDSEDIVQQSLVRVLLSIGRYDGRSPLRSWLLAIVYREFLKWRRRKLWLPLPAERVAIGVV